MLPDPSPLFLIRIIMKNVMMNYPTPEIAIKSSFPELLIMIRTRFRNNPAFMNGPLSIGVNITAKEYLKDFEKCSLHKIEKFTQELMESFHGNSELMEEMFGKEVLLSLINANFWIHALKLKEELKQKMALEYKPFQADLSYRFAPWYHFSQKRLLKCQLKALDAEITNYKFNW